MDIKGKCVQVNEMQSIPKKDGSGEWHKQDFIIETEGQYPKKVCIQMFGKICDEVYPAVGDVLTCQINLESREYNSKWYTQVNAWKVEGFTGNLKRSPSSDNGVFDEPSSLGGPPAHERKENFNTNADVNTDDLPF